LFWSEEEEEAIVVVGVLEEGPWSWDLRDAR
jgi:hypothetical protein